jgi:PST family polysaccharide transporter
MMKNKDFDLIKKLLLIFMPLILVGTLLTVFLSKYIILLFAGSEYIEAISVFRVLSFLLLFTFPTMLLGFPLLGAIGKNKDVTKSTIFAAFFHITTLGVIILFGVYNIIYVAILRVLTEVFLLIYRIMALLRYRRIGAFNKEESITYE